MTDATIRFAADPAAAVRRQCAALCWRMEADAPQILLITSRDTGRWVVPKGWPMPGLSPARTAAREAFEEAGVRGTVDERSLGCFGYEKVLGQGAARGLRVACVVAVFPLRVEGLEDDFPEAGQRQRAWFAPAEAAARVDEPDLARLLAAFRPADGDGPAA